MAGGVGIHGKVEEGESDQRIDTRGRHVACELLTLVPHCRRLNVNPLRILLPLAWSFVCTVLPMFLIAQIVIYAA